MKIRTESASNEVPETAEGPSSGIPATLPVLPLSDIVLFPYMIVPLFIVPERSARAVNDSLADNRTILAVSQRVQDIDEPGPQHLYQYGTVASIMRMLKLPDERVRILIQGVSRARVEYLPDDGPYLKARVFPDVEAPYVGENPEVEALVRNIKSALERVISLGKNIPHDIAVIAANLEDPGRLADLVASNLDLKAEQAQELLEALDPVERLRGVHQILARETEVLEIQHHINTQAKGEIDRTQREYYLRQQMKAIQQELGEGNELGEEIARYQERVRKAGMPEEAAEEASRQIARLERMHPDSAETATIRNYLDWMVELPWSTVTEDNLDLDKAEGILEEDHFGLEKVKERILEHLAVRKLKPSTRGPILCFVGPPGVGKTSLGRSIARALGRKFIRLSLGGVHDEAEIRGHRRTYVGAMPGRVIQSIHHAGSKNPVFMMDEVDKIGSDFRGDPSAALLEVLDPEQNYAFRDNYLGVPFDLSNVMFITTANVLDTIQPAFRDRMEVIQLGGYTDEEKLAIAKRHLIPRQLNEHGLKAAKVEFTDEAVQAIISGYTREAGLRNLEREIGSVCRKIARGVASGHRSRYRLGTRQISRYLGRPRIVRDTRLRKNLVGVATGLAWTPAGGDILFVEATAMKGKGGITLTGQLGEVMRESAQAAISYTRAHAQELGLDEEFFGSHDIHVHVPEGAIPKDGPSAGLTIATAIISLVTRRAVRRSIALTGEITLRGEVLPVGGIKEKVLAAQRAGITTVLLPSLNRRDVEDIEKELRTETAFKFVKNIHEAVAAAIVASGTRHGPHRATDHTARRG